MIEIIEPIDKIFRLIRNIKLQSLPDLNKYFLYFFVVRLFDI